MSYDGCYVAVCGQAAEDIGVVMWQFWGVRLRIGGLLCGNLKPEWVEDIGVVMRQFWGGSLKIWGLSFGVGGRTGALGGG